MKKTKFFRFTIVLFILVGLITLAGSVSARPHMFAKEQMERLEQGALLDKPGFFSGEFIQIDGNINGTTFASGDQIEINGDINGSLFVLGDTIRINGEINGNIYGIGSRVQLTGQNNGDIFFAGETVVLSQDAEVGRDSFVAGMDVLVEGDVPRHLFAIGEIITLNSSVGGNVTVNSEEVRLNDSALIAGNFQYEGPREPEWSSGATVEGETTYTQRETWDRQWSVDRGDMWAFRLGFALWSLLSAVVVWLVFKLLSPRFWMTQTLAIRNMPLMSAGLGLAALIVTPFLSIFLALTIIGIPMSIILTLLYGIALYLSRIIVALYIGATLMRVLGKKTFSNEFVLVVIGLILIELLMLVPIVGWVVGLIVAIIGLGALVTSIYNNTRLRQNH